MPKGYVILTEDIHDPAGMAAYGAASTGPLVDFGGRVLVVDENVEVLEGEWHGTGPSSSSTRRSSRPGSGTSRTGTRPRSR